MSPLYKHECPKCYTERTMLDTSFALPGYKGTLSSKETDCINSKCVLPVKLLLCPRCHLIEFYHDVGQKE